MKTNFFSKNTITDENLQELSMAMKKGEIIAFPTETVYGLGASIWNEEAIKKIFILKNRKFNKGLIIHIESILDVQKVAYNIPSDFYTLADHFFPGPLTIVLPKKTGISNIISPDDTIAIRMPDNAITLKLIKFLQNPIVGTSANFSNEKSSISADEVKQHFQNKIFAIIDDGKTKIKMASTILSLTDSKYKILRQGVITKEQIETVLKRKIYNL